MALSGSKMEIPHLRVTFMMSCGTMNKSLQCTSNKYSDVGAINTNRTHNKFFWHTWMGGWVVCVVCVGGGGVQQGGTHFYKKKAKKKAPTHP